MANEDEGPRDDERGKKPLVTPRRAAAGLGAAAAAAYAVYVFGARRTRRRPVTELRNALGPAIQYQKWGDVHYAYYARQGTGRPVVFFASSRIGVSTNPGCTELTRTPPSAQCSATFFVSVRTAPLAAW